MAGAGRRTFQPGEVLTASNVNSYLMDQSVMRFADSAARGSAIGTAVIAEGMVSYLDDTNSLSIFDGSNWSPLNVGSGGTGGTTVAEAQDNLGIGLVPISSGSAAAFGTGSSISKGVSGAVTFDNATAIALDGIFTSAFNNYRMIVTFESTSNAAVIRSEFRKSGVSITSANYLWGIHGLSSGAGYTATAIGETSLISIPSTLSATVSVMDLHFPQPTKTTKTPQVFCTAFRSRDIYDISARHTTASEYDGFNFFISSGTISGEVMIFGYNQ